MMLVESQNWNERKLRHFCADFIFFTGDDAIRAVRNSVDSQGLEAWRRLHNEYDPTFNHEKSDNL